MKLTKYFMPLAALALLASCSDDKVDNPNQGGNNGLDAAYFTITVTQAEGTRTTTGSQGSETPQTSEQTINNLTLVFVDENTSGNERGKVLAISDMATPANAVTNGTTSFKQTFKVAGTNVEALSGKSNVGLYVVCNLKGLNYSLGNVDVQKTLSYTEDNNEYWSNGNGCLMSNSEAVKVDGPLPNDWTNYTESEPYPLGKTIKVQRAMARFDVCTAQPATNTVNGIKVVMEAVSMVNISSNFFLFKEVGTSTNWVLLAKEEADNFVNDPKASEKESLTKKGDSPSSDKDFTDLFLNPAGLTKPNSMTWSSFTQLEDEALKRNGFTQENDPNKETEPEGNPVKSRDYYFWRYTTPSTITNEEKQLNGNTTGIVFKAELKKVSDETVIPGWEENDMIALENVIYGDLAAVKKIAADPKDAAQQRVAYLYNNISPASNDTPSNAELTAAGFSVYPVEGNKYYAYYYYWNRHNAVYNAPNDGDMGIMEFGVVRNNIYKLAVTKISGLGLPGDQTPDPDDPDEPKDKDGWFSVSVQVIPWEVRVNDIEF